MRITCPNCGAQYEVPDEVIPADGRDVQCSNCGDTWFQAHPDYPLDEPEPEAAPEPPPPPPPPPPRPDPAPPRPETRAPTPRQIDPDVAEILREEAAHESRLRAREGETLESQGDLGLDSLPPSEPSNAGREARDRMARLRGETPPPAPDRPRSRLLPDVEEINSTLTASDKPAPQPTPEQAKVDFPVAAPPRRSGFMRGFSLVLVLAALLVVVYLQADAIAEAVPATAPALQSYVETVNAARLWIDSKLAAYVPR